MKSFRRLFASVILAGVVSPGLAGNALYLFSEIGDYIGQGQEKHFTDADGSFDIARNYDQGVSVGFDDGGTEWWNLAFAAPGSVDLVPGVYDDATRFPFQGPDEPGLSVSGSGRGCNELSGRFEVLEAEYDTDGTVLAFAADFEQHCEGRDPALFGSVRYNSALPVITGHTLLHFDSEPGDYIGQGEENTWRRSTGRFETSRNYDNGISVDYDDDQAGTWWSLDFAGPMDAPLEVGLYEGATRFPFQDPSEPGLSVSGSGRGCSGVEGSFEVLEVSYTGTGEVERLAIDFDQLCDSSTGWLRGAVRFNSKIPVAPAQGGGPAHPWQDNASGTQVISVGWDFAMGYNFTPLVNGQITALGGLFEGSKSVRLFDYQTGDLLAETTVISQNDWAYGNIPGVDVTAGRTYTVAVYLAGSGGSYRYGTDLFPRTYGDVRIEGTIYSSSGSDPDARPTTLWQGTYMFGQADVRFVSSP